jgi:transcriptional regulator with XRE-family HTH domain
MMQGSLAEKLRVLRAREGLSLTEAAARAGVTRDTLSDVEHGKRQPYMPTLSKIATGYGVPVEELLEEPTQELAGASPLGKAPQETGRPKEAPISLPTVQAWLAEQGHVSAEEFISWARGLDPEVDEDGIPQGIERGIEELHAKRDELIDALRTSAARKTLFPVPPGLSGEATRAWLLKPPGRWELINEIRHEYLARELALVNYSKQLFAEGETEDYLTYVRDPRRHAKMLAERQRVLEEKYDAALAVA